MFPIQITVRHISTSAALEALIHKRAEKLSHLYHHIVTCHVVVEFIQKHKHQGKIYDVRLYVTVRGKELVVNHQHDEKVHVAVRDAFNAIERQLDEYSHKRHGDVKKHDDVLHGHVVRVLQDKGYGFIEGVDGNEYYFSIMTNDNHPHFPKLCVGDSVVYIPDIQKDGDGLKAHRILRNGSSTY